MLQATMKQIDDWKSIARRQAVDILEQNQWIHDDLDVDSGFEVTEDRSIYCYGV